MRATVGVLVVSGLMALAVSLPGPAFAKSECVFTIRLPKMHVFPLLDHVKGDGDMQGAGPRVDLTALIHQPTLRGGERARNLRIDLNLRISDVKGDGTAFVGRQNFWLHDRWLVSGGTMDDMRQCLDDRFRRCIEIFKEGAVSNQALQLQCGNAARLEIKDLFRATTGNNSRQWTLYQKKVAKLVQSAECLGDASGADTGKLGCRNITFRPTIVIDANFGHQALAR